MTVTVSVGCDFSAGHRVLGLSGSAAKCGNLHGHTYRAVFSFVHGTMEFDAIKAILRVMVAELFDHGFLVGRDDEFLSYLREHKLKHYVIEGPPSTEAIACELARRAIHALPLTQLVCVELRAGSDNVATAWSTEGTWHAD